MKTVIIICLVLIAINIKGQVISLSVLGKTIYYEEAILGCLELSIPKINNEAINLMRQTEEHNLKYLELDLNGNSKYLYTTTNFDSLHSDILKFINCDFQVEKVYFKFNEHNFRNEDIRAIESIENATKAAKLLTESIGYEIKGILNIDDDTDRNENADWFTCTSEDIEKMLTSMGFFSFDVDIIDYPTEASNKIIDSTYSMWVTFEIKKNNSR